MPDVLTTITNLINSPPRALAPGITFAYCQVMSDDRFQKCAEDYLKSIKRRASCAWCRNPRKATYRNSGMCRSCYEIRRKLRKLHKQVMAANAEFGKNWPELGTRSNRLFRLEMDYIIAIEMAESAQVLGRAYEDLLDEASPLECEWEFRLLSKRFLKKDLFNHTAFLFQCFSPVHRRYRMYLIGIMMQEFYSRNRRKMSQRSIALGIARGKGMEEVLAGRAWGTYRVEDDGAVSARGKKR